MDLVALAEQWNSLGLIPFLIVLFVRMERKLDAQSAAMEARRKEHDGQTTEMVRGWEKQLVAMVNKYEEREDEIRSRYDNVISNYNTERDRMFRDMDRKLDDAIRFFQSR